ncbi:MAG TPA: response regulator, partial [Campylobacterales bacterium]|nr:response regulator [Campylobacterales bacterium]
MLPIKTEIKDRALIVDDTKTIVQILSVVLKKEGFDVISASSGEEALLLLETESVDVVLMDIQMDNGIDGFETCRILKNTAKTKDIPVVFLTAFDDLDTKVAGFEAGGVDFISKSFDKIEILTRVKSQVRLSKLQNSLKSGLAYIRAILDAEKQLVAIYDESLNLENYNQAFADIFSPDANFLISRRLNPYEKYASPASDEKLFETLSAGQLFKSRIDGAGGVFGIELTEARVLGDTKKILTISDISAHEVAKKQEMELLKFKERYHNAQQQDAFKKQKKIIQDEISHLFKHGWLFDSHYRPLDILSGDTFGAIKINDDRYLFYIVDAMGKGLSASVTSIQSTSFINNSVDQAIERGDFKLEDVIKPFCHFIKKQLLSDELLCIVFLDFDMKNESIKIANYGMPPILLEADNVIRNIKPNNAPIMSFFSSDIIDDISLKDVIKIALYSDGLNEAACNDDKPYSNSIDADFRESTLIREFLKAFESKTSKLDDDVTLIFISKPSMKN